MAARQEAPKFPVIHFSHVSKRYESGADALRNVSFDIARGEMVFVTGHSGAGKSTLLRLIGGLTNPSSGEIVVGGVKLEGLSRRRVSLLRRSIGYVFQDHRLLSDRTVFDNVALPLVIAGMPHEEIVRRVRAALAKVTLLGKEPLLPSLLSGGEQQRVGIARAVVNRPPVIIADEPTGNLDPGLSREIMSLFTSFAQLGSTVLVATHDLMLLREYPFRILVLNRGRMTELDRAELYAR